VVVVIGADLGGDGESGGHRNTQVGHLGDVGALATEQIFHFRRAFGLAVTEEIHIFFRRQFHSSTGLGDYNE
jgi:hypothetical protein